MIRSWRMRIYLDHNATTPVDPGVVETITRVLRDPVRQRLQCSRIRTDGTIDRR